MALASTMATVINSIPIRYYVGQAAAAVNRWPAQQQLAGVAQRRHLVQLTTPAALIWLSLASFGAPAVPARLV